MTHVPRSPRRRFVPVLLLALMLPACSMPIGDTDLSVGDVHVATAPPELVVTNHTSAAVYTFAVGRQTSALINWAAGVDGRGLMPGATQRLPYADIYGIEGEEEVIVYWWHADIRDGKRVPGDIQFIVVDL